MGCDMRRCALAAGEACSTGPRGGQVRLPLLTSVRLSKGVQHIQSHMDSRREMEVTLKKQQTGFARGALGN